MIRTPALAGEAFRHRLFPENPAAAHYRPIQTLTLQVDYWCWGLNPFGYHLTNILLQGLAAGLLYTLLRRLLATPGPLRPTGMTNQTANATAFAVALLWGIHPAHNAAVAYIAGRADPLSFTFAAAGWLTLWRAAQPEVSHARQILGGLVGALALLLALLSRESAACWVVLVAASISLFTARERPAGRWLVAFALLAAVGGYVGVRAYCLIPETLPTASAPAFDLRDRLLLALQALTTYGQTLLWPARLLLDRTLGIEAALLAQAGAAGGSRFTLWLAPATLTGAVLLIGLLAGAALRWGRGWRLRRFGAGWFLVSFLPVSNLVPLNATVADHWLYLPSIGLLLVLVGWWQEAPTFLRRFAFPAMVFATLLLAGRAGWRSRDWRKATTFYARTIADGGDSARMRYNLTQAQLRSGDRAAAETTLAGTLVQFPGFFPAQLLADRLRATLEGEGESARAERLQAWRERLPAGDPEAARTLTVELARARLRAGQAEAALALTRTQPDDPEARTSRWQPLLALRVEALGRLGRVEEALAETTAFVRTHPWHQEAAFCLSELQTAAGDDRAALSTLSRADSLDVRGTGALERMAALYVHRGDFARALACEQAAVAVAPRDAGLRQQLGLVHALLQQDAEAQHEFAIADRLKLLPDQTIHPDSPSLVGKNIPGIVQPVRSSSPSVSSTPSSQGCKP